MLVTRDIINPDIEFIDVRASNKTFTFDKLCNGIDNIKDILLNEYGCKKGDAVLIGVATSTLQVATFFACAELGLQVIVLDHGRDDNWIAQDYIDPKTQSLLPIKFFIVDSQYKVLNSLKYEFFKKISSNFLVLHINTLNLKREKKHIGIHADADSILLKCTSSGTTGTAKIVQHTHEFLNKLIVRNKVFYHDNICMITNLNHGSSPATYFLPALCSERTKKFISFVNINNDDKSTHPAKRFVNTKYNFSKLSAIVHDYDIKHLMLPYSHMIQDFLNSGQYPNLTLYTLSTIPSAWLENYRESRIFNIISFFGCNETSGPVLINEVKDQKFQESHYKLIDDFYSIELNGGTNLEVAMPVYGKSICTNDMFEFVDGYYKHKGRNDLYRVNGSIVDLPKYNAIASEKLNATLVVDTMKDKLYLAIWESVEDLEYRIDNISKQYTELSNATHKLDKVAILEKDRFFTGVKLDMELIRDYFRKFV